VLEVNRLQNLATIMVIQESGMNYCVRIAALKNERKANKSKILKVTPQ
jgi:hypothetical protein